MRTDRALPGPDAWHHPHFVSVEVTRWGIQWAFKAFTGREPEPKLPADLDVYPETAGYGSPEWEAYDWRQHEIHAAQDLWKAAQFKTEFRRLILAVAPKWAPLNQARKALDAAFAALDDTKTEDWNAALLRLSRARDAARGAAEDWDRDSDVFDLAVHSWRSFRTDHFHELVGALAENAKEAGLGEVPWQDDVPDVYDDGHGGYRLAGGFGSWDSGNATAKIQATIDKQDRTLAEVTRLAGIADQ